MRKNIIYTIIAAFCLISCSQKTYIQISGFAQGGTYTVKCAVQGNANVVGNELRTGIDSILSVIDRSVSGYNPGSLLSRHNAGQEITDDGSAEYRVFRELSGYCDSLHTATGGVLDTRAAELFDIWGFGFKEGRMPADDEVRTALGNREKMNFNAVAQGYSADAVASYLRDKGVEDMMVNIGGEIFCCGLNPAGKGWTLGIDEPRDGNMSPGKDMECTFTVPAGQSCGIVTSGNYRKFYVVDGVKYSHTVDPRTGYPVRHNLLSATVIAPTAALADALATYCMVIGMEEASAFIAGRPDLEGCLISSDTVWHSEGLEISGR
ncbi:MAG: FAD:protein FMN transferase [Bacteroidales bacterium]|nr:FAD:protein FMN transferase [Candidatus Hennigimonas equi]